MVEGAGFHIACREPQPEDATPGSSGVVALNAISTVIAMVEAEGCAAGMWERVEGGYRILDQELLGELLIISTQMRDRAAQCHRAGGHAPDSRARMCTVCLRPLNLDHPHP